MHLKIQEIINNRFYFERNEKNMKEYPECEYRYNPIGYELCNHGNENIHNHKKHIAGCCANVCPLGKYRESEKLTTKQMYERDMKIIDNLSK
jgi:hypothetical protein